MVGKSISAENGKNQSLIKLKILKGNYLREGF